MAIIDSARCYAALRGNISNYKPLVALFASKFVEATVCSNTLMVAAFTIINQIDANGVAPDWLLCYSSLVARQLLLHLRVGKVS